uniref:hypothetical protein n=1 Tax=Streptococcus uberis TaxID=1349 RepID=UPI003CCFE3D0
MGISYKILSVIFTSQNLSENIILKILYYLFAILVGYLLFYLIRRKELKNVLEILPKNLKRYTITFSTNKIRTFEWYFWIFVNLVNFYFYLTLNNGIEIYLVMLGSLLVFVTLLITLLMTPVEHSYNHGIIKFESISRK